MPDLDYFILCDSVCIDAQSNRPVFFLVIDQAFVVQEFPTNYAQLVAITAWRAKSDDVGGEYQATVKMYLPGSESPHDFPLNFTINREYFRLIHAYQFVPLQRAGEIRFEVLLNGELKLSRSVPVYLADQA